jgi:hypothetical protein
MLALSYNQRNEKKLANTSTYSPSSNAVGSSVGNTVGKAVG